MKMMTGISEDGLTDVLSDIKDAGLSVVSVTKTDSTYTVVYGPATSPAAGAGSDAAPAPRPVAPSLPTVPPVANMDDPEPAPTGAPEAFVHARPIAARTILYVDAAGREQVREGGSRAWRNCNPGNIRKGDFSINCGAIGDDGSFAVFPDEATGTAAIISLLKSKAYFGLSLGDAISRYAPPSENNTAEYIANVAADTGIDPATILSTLNADAFRRLAKSIRKIEGWQVGIVRGNVPPAPVLSALLGVGSSAASAAQDWMTVARAEAALPPHDRSEWDPGDNPRILNYLKVCAPWFNTSGGDEVEWCAAFVNYCLVTSGHMGTDNPGARSFFWNKKKQFVSLPGPASGAIGVIRRAPFADPAWTNGHGHVGFITAWTADSITLLGGNQSNTVKEKTFALVETDAAGATTAKFVAFMMPVII